MRFTPGPGFFTVGFTLGADGGAIAVLERRVARVAPAVEIRPDPLRALHRLEDDADLWLDSFVVRHIEAFGADRRRLEVVERIVALVNGAPLDGETTLLLDVTEIGESLRSSFHGRFNRRNHWTPIVVRRDVTTTEKDGEVALANVCSAIVSLLESERLRAAGQVPHKNEVARLEQDARAGSLSRVGLAIGLAAEFGARLRTRGPWAGRRKPTARADIVALEEAQMRSTLRRELLPADDYGYGYDNDDDGG